MNARAASFKPGVGLITDNRAPETDTSIEAKVRRHVRKECMPCAYFQGKEDGCRWGDDCKFCHLCPKGALQQLKHKKLRRIRLESVLASKALAKSQQAEPEAGVQNVPETSNDVIEQACLVSALVTKYADEDDDDEVSTRASLDEAASRQLFPEQATRGSLWAPPGLERAKPCVVASPGLERAGLRGALTKFGLPAEAETRSDIIQLDDVLYPASDLGSVSQSSSRSQVDFPWLDTGTAGVEHYAASQTSSQVKSAWIDHQAALQTSSQAVSAHTALQTCSQTEANHAMSQAPTSAELWLAHLQ